MEAVRFRRLNCLQYFLNAGYAKHGDMVWWPRSLLYEAITFSETYHGERADCVTELLRWGINNVEYNMSDDDLPHWIPQIPKHSLFSHAASKHCWKTMKHLKQLNPQYLQDHWFVEHPWDLASLEEITSEELAQFVADLYEERKNPPQLEILCRTKIFEQLGFNPIPKVEKLPLPQSLKHFVQCKDIEGL